MGVGWKGAGGRWKVSFAEDGRLEMADGSWVEGGRREVEGGNEKWDLKYRSFGTDASPRRPRTRGDTRPYRSIIVLRYKLRHYACLCIN